MRLEWMNLNTEMDPRTDGCMTIVYSPFYCIVEVTIERCDVRGEMGNNVVDAESLSGPALQKLHVVPIALFTTNQLCSLWNFTLICTRGASRLRPQVLKIHIGLLLVVRKRPSFVLWGASGQIKEGITGTCGFFRKR